MGDFPCVHGPPYIPDRNGNCPLRGYDAALRFETSDQ